MCHNGVYPLKRYKTGVFCPNIGDRVYASKLGASQWIQEGISISISMDVMSNIPQR